MFFNAKKEIKIIEMNIKVYATGVSLATSNRQWSTYYEFIDVDGTKYGTWRGGVSKSEAEAQLGKQLEIYIDGKGYCVQVGDSPKPHLWIIFLTTLLIFVCGEAILYICLRKKMKRQETINVLN